MLNIVIKGSGSFTPPVRKTNAEFADQDFYKDSGVKFDVSGEEIIEKFYAITEIEERRYASPEERNSDIAAKAAAGAIADAGIDKEELDYILVGQNFGDVNYGQSQISQVPSIAARVKYLLGIENPHCVGFDIIFGCPGWLETVITGEAFMRSGKAKKILTIGSETLSRVVDPFDRDSMIFADGAGAVLFEAVEENEKRGILSSSEMTHALREVYYLDMGPSNNPEEPRDKIYVKMQGRRIYNYALSYVPAAMKETLEKAGIDIRDLKKIFLHQANAKMDHAIVERFYKLYNMEVPEHVMPMSIHKMGNSSVATIPTLLDWVRKGKQEEHSLHPGDIILFASVGAGMNINAVAYRI